MKQFNDDYLFEYEELYIANFSGQYVNGSREALDYFENNLTDNELEILREFCQYRQDIISSDREAIAFVFTLEKRNQ